MLKVIKESAAKHVIVLHSREAGYASLWNFVILLGGGASVISCLAAVLNFALSGMPLDWMHFGIAIGTTTATGLVILHTKRSPVMERSLLLEPGRIALIQERFSRPAFEVISRDSTVVDLAADSGVALLMDEDGSPNGIEIWGPSSVLRIPSFGPDNARQLHRTVAAWIERPAEPAQSAAPSSAIELAPADDEVADAVAVLSNSRWVSVEYQKAPEEFVRLSIQPRGPELGKFLGFLPAFWVLVGFGCYALSQLREPFPALWTALALAMAGALTITMVRELFELVEIQLSRTEVTKTSTLFGWKRRRSVPLNLQVEAGFQAKSADSNQIIPTVCIRCGPQEVAFGTMLSSDDKRQLVRLIRAFLQLDRESNLFLSDNPVASSQKPYWRRLLEKL